MSHDNHCPEIHVHIHQPELSGAIDLLRVTLLEELRKMAKLTQEQIDGLTAELASVGTAIGTALDGIQADIAALKAENPDLNIAGLLEKVSALSALGARAAAIDAENPTP
jgi:hypothetical protein